MNRNVRNGAIAAVIVGAVVWLLAKGPGGNADGPYGKEVADAIPRIEEATGLKFKTKPRVETRTKEQIHDFLIKKFNEQSPAAEIAGQEAAYKVLGLLPDSMDLRKFSLAIYTEQVIGLYDPKAKTLFVVGDVTDDLASVTITHELVHALQDQYTNVDSLMNSTKDDDRLSAIQAVVEGEAVFEQMSIAVGGSSNIALRVGGRDRIREMIRERASSMPVYATAPMVIQESMLFPYLTGADFVQRFREKRGKENIFAAVPRSTEQLLHTEAYFGPKPDEPSVVTLPPVKGATKIYENDLGEFGTRLFIYAHTKDERVAALAAAGWDGDRYVVVKNGNAKGIVWASVWDSTMEAAEFIDALIRATSRRTGIEENREAGGGATFHPSGRVMSIFPRVVDGRAVVIYSDLPTGMSGVIDPTAIKVESH